MIFFHALIRLLGGFIILILNPFFSRLRRAFTSMILVICFGVCNEAIIVSWFWVNVFLRWACIILILAQFFCVYGELTQFWFYINIFSLVAGLWSGNFGSIFLMFWRHCTILILAPSFSCAYLAWVIVILVLFYAPTAGLYYWDVGSFFLCICLGQ